VSNYAKFYSIAGVFLWMILAPDGLALANAGERDMPSSSTTVSNAERECVILVHGLGARKSRMSALEKALTAHGFDVVNWDYRSTRQTISESAARLYECYQLNERHHSKVHLVTHSLGGIVVRCMLKDRAVPKLGKIVMIAPPNQGSAVARTMLKGPLSWVAGSPGEELKSKEYLDQLCVVPKTDALIIAGTRPFDPTNASSYVAGAILEKPHDGTVSVAETRLEGLMEPVLIDDSHRALPTNPKVVTLVLQFLQDSAGRENERSTLEAGLKILQQDPQRIKIILSSLPSMPNVKLKTLGGKVWWADLVNVGGWRVQENVLFGNCRLLDPKNVRQAWGEKKNMVRAFEAVVAGTARPK
jgi:pimeloyl-ACP methyl ester carboxylesterase